MDYLIYIGKEALELTPIVKGTKVILDDNGNEIRRIDNYTIPSYDYQLHISDSAKVDEAKPTLQNGKIKLDTFPESLNSKYQVNTYIYSTKFDKQQAGKAYDKDGETIYESGRIILGRIPISSNDIITKPYLFKIDTSQCNELRLLQTPIKLRDYNMFSNVFTKEYSINTVGEINLPAVFLNYGRGSNPSTFITFNSNDPGSFIKILNSKILGKYYEWKFEYFVNKYSDYDCWTWDNKTLDNGLPLLGKVTFKNLPTPISTGDWEYDIRIWTHSENRFNFYFLLYRWETYSDGTSAKHIVPGWTGFDADRENITVYISENGNSWKVHPIYNLWTDSHTIESLNLHIGDITTDYKYFKLKLKNLSVWDEFVSLETDPIEINWPLENLNNEIDEE